MTANQIPFDTLDWLQFGVYFVALPLVAMLGSAIGLLGRVRRGGILWAANVGLLGGAVSCVIVALGISTLEGESSTNYFFSFMEVMRWKMLAVALAATWACSCAAAIAWRFLHPPREMQPWAISLQSLLLVQLFAFISMGSFIGLRLYMLQSVDFNLADYFYEGAEDEFTEPGIPGWYSYGGGERLVLNDHEVSAAEVQAAFSPEQLQKIASLKQLKDIHFSLDSQWKIDLSPLLDHKEFEFIGVDCLNPTMELIEKLAMAKTSSIALRGDFRDVDLTPISQSSTMKEISLYGDFTRRSVEALANSQSLTSLSLGACKLTKDQPSIARWPPNLTKLSILASSANNDDIAAIKNHHALRELNLNYVVLNDEATLAIGALHQLESLSATIGPLSQPALDGLANLPLTAVRLQVSNPAFSPHDAKQILRIKGLIYLNLIDAVHGDDVVEALSQDNSVRAISISSPSVTAEAVFLLAQINSLESLEYPAHLDTPSFHNGFAIYRCELNLPSVHLRKLVTSPSAKQAESPKNQTP